MSNELDEQINDSLQKEKILYFYKKFKFYIILVLSILIILPLTYQIYNYLEKEKNAKNFEDYSFALNELRNGRGNNAYLIFEKLADSDNSTIVMLSFNQLYQIYKNDRRKIMGIIEKIIKKNNLNKNSLELIKLKKSLMIFDQANEQDMLELLNIKDKNNYVYRLALEIMFDFYKKNKQINKADEIKSLINEK